MQFNLNIINIIFKHNIVNNKLLMNFYATLKDYNIGRIYPSYVDFEQYEFSNENFIHGIVFAIRKDNQNLNNPLNLGKKYDIPKL